MRDIAIDPNNPNILIANEIAGMPGVMLGIYRSTNALAASPTFVQTQVFNEPVLTSDIDGVEFAAIHPAGDTDATFYAAHRKPTAVEF